MQAEPRAQLVLLDIAAIDQQAAKMRHEKKTLPVLAELQELAKKRVAVIEESVAMETQVGDAQLELDRVLADLEPAQQRLARNQKIIDEGSVDAKQLQQVLRESEHLTGRIAKLEDEQLEADVTLEDLTKEFDEIKQRRTDLENQMRELIKQRDAQAQELDEKLAEGQTERDQISKDVPADLLAAYEKTAEKQLTGAARYSGGKCEGCRIQLDAEQRQRIDELDPTQVVRCPNCNRILVSA